MNDLHNLGRYAFHFLDAFRPEAGVLLDFFKFGVGQPAGLGDDVDINAQLAQIVQETTEAKGLELFFGQLAGTTNGEGKDRDVDRMGKGVVVIIFQHRQGQHGVGFRHGQLGHVFDDGYGLFR